jgi:hypothetical protein
LFFSFVAALCWVIADVARGIGESRANGVSTTVTFAAIMFLLLIDFILALLNMLPAVIVRSMVAQGPMEGVPAVLVSLIHYSTYFLLIRLPYNLIMGTFRVTSATMAMSLVAYMAWAIMSYVAAYFVITMPPLLDNSIDTLYVPLNDSEKCLTALGDFMTLLVSQLGERRQIEKLWSPVYSYLKDTMKVQKLILNKGLRHDEIALNAVGSIAFQLLCDGALHDAFGTLSLDGVYVRKVWWVTANELVRRSYYRPEDVTQGIQALDAAIVAVGPKQ